MKKILNNRPILTAQWATVLYLLLLFVVYPLYLKDGYYDIDYAKYACFKAITLGGLVAMLVGLIIQACMRRIPKQFWTSFSVVDICMLAYLVVNVISMLCSYDRMTALWGQEGWFMGEVTILSMVVVYFFVTRLFLGSKYLVAAIILASAVVMGLGILNRFGIWPIDIEIPYEYSYLSTLGNIGWYSGYIAVVAPLGIGLYIIKNNSNRTEHLALSIYMFVTFVAGICQGGDSIFIFFGILFLGTLVCASVYSQGIKHWLEMLIMWCLAGQVVHIIRMIWPQAYGYDSDNVCGRFNNSYASLWLLIPILVVYVLVLITKLGENQLVIWCMRVIPLCVMVVLLVWFAVSVIYSNATGIQTPSEELGVLGRLLFIDMDWGGGRGTAMNIGLNIWLEQGMWHKLIGIGPDCFANYVFYSDQYSGLVSMVFGNRLLPNAHNEFITNLANIGLLGVISYYGILVAFLWRCKQYWKRDMRILAIALCLICYTGYNTLNYAELLNYPFYIALIAIGETWIKQLACSGRW